MMKSRYAQGAVEFTLITTGVLLLFSVGFIVAEQQFLKVQETKLDEKAQEVIDQIETEILLAKEAGEGYQRYFVLPQTLDGAPYNIDLLDNETNSSSDELVLLVDDKEYFLFLTVDVEGNISTGYNNITGGEVVGVENLGDNFTDECLIDCGVSQGVSDVIVTKSLSYTITNTSSSDNSEYTIDLFYTINLSGRHTTSDFMFLADRLDTAQIAELTGVVSVSAPQQVIFTPSPGSNVVYYTTELERPTKLFSTLAPDVMNSSANLAITRLEGDLIISYTLTIVTDSVDFQNEFDDSVVAVTNGLIGSEFPSNNYLSVSLADYPAPLDLWTMEDYDWPVNSDGSPSLGPRSDINLIYLDLSTAVLADDPAQGLQAFEMTASSSASINSSDIDFSSSDSFSIAFFFRPAERLSSGILKDLYLLDYPNRAVLFFDSSGNLNFGVGTSPSSFVRSTTNNWDANKWYHLLVTYYPNNTGSIYVNGVFEASLSIDEMITVTAHDSLIIGSKSTGLMDGFTGAIDDLVVWNTSLSESQVTNFYNSRNAIN